MSPEDADAEIAYLKDERRGLMAEDRKTTPEQEQIVNRQITQWFKEYQNEIED
jgi:hypothetical protein